MVLEIIAAVIVVVVVAVALWLILTYNGFIQLRNRIDNAWSQIDVQLKKRFDLIPNLVETVKGYAKHEKETFKMVTEARTRMMNARSVRDTAEAENMLTGALKTLFAVSENYPQLKANQNFLMLQEEISGIETKIAYSRQFYNDEVLKLNTKAESFPDSFIASVFGFRKRDYFEVADAEKSSVKVKF